MLRDDLVVIDGGRADWLPARGHDDFRMRRALTVIVNPVFAAPP